jgi:S-DNA-T family DNA segregation ATPase FtsK/SpoIIIE
MNSAKKYTGSGAVSVPVLPDKVTESFLSLHIKKGNLSCVPIGVEKNTLEISYYDFTDSPVNLVLSVSQEWQEFIDMFASMMAGGYGIKTIIIAPAGKAKSKSNADKAMIFSSVEDCVGAVHDIFEIVLERNNEYKDKLASGGALPQFEHVMVIIQSMSLLKTMLERYKPTTNKKKEAGDDTMLNRLQLAMEKCDKEYNVHFVVAESLNQLTPFTVESWYKTHISGNNGIWVGSGINSQYRLTVSKKPQDISAELDSDFGFVIKSAVATLVKLLQ